MHSLPEPSRSSETYRIGDLRIDVGQRAVTRGDAAISLPKLSFDLLLVLIRAAPNVVSIDEFMERVWPGLVVSPETVSQRVKLLRDAIGDDPRDAKYVAGVRGLGYRLIANVGRAEISGSAESLEPGLHRGPSTAVKDPSAPQSQLYNKVAGRKSAWRPSAIGLLIIGVVAIGAIGIAVFLANTRQPHDSVLVTGTALRTVAVLPFDNLSASRENDYIGVGLSEMVLNRLSAVPSLQVVARTSSFSFQGKNLEAQEIGRRLNADYLVRGSVQRSGDSLRLTAQLIDVSSGRQIKSLHLDKSLQEIFSIEDEVADSVAAALALRMGDVTQFRPEQARNVSLAAYLEYMQGRAALGHFKFADMQTAAAHFQRAIDIDPNFAAAYSSLADAQRWIKQSLSEIDPHAEHDLEALVNKAIHLDPGLGEAYIERASLHGDTPESEADFRKGLELSPSYGLGYAYFAESLSEWNRNEEAMQVLDHAVRIDPLSGRAPYMKALLQMGKSHTLAAAREAEAQMMSVLAVDPEFTNALVRIGEIKAMYFGELAEGLHFVERALRADPGAEWIVETAIALYSEIEDGAALRNLASAAGDHSWLGRVWVSSYEGNWRKAAQLELNRPARVDYLGDIAIPVLAIQIYARQTREFDRCIAHLRSHFHLQEGHELDRRQPQFAPVLAMAQILKDKGDAKAARRLAMDVLEVLERSGPALPWVFAPDVFRGKAHLILGEPDAALRDFAHASNAEFANGLDYFWSIQHDNMWDPIRGDPRFHALMSRQRAHIDQQRMLLEDMRKRGEIPTRADP